MLSSASLLEVDDQTFICKKGRNQILWVSSSCSTTIQTEVRTLTHELWLLWKHRVGVFTAGDFFQMSGIMEGVESGAFAGLL